MRRADAPVYTTGGASAQLTICGKKKAEDVDRKPAL
jgi:hypothetical protein